jgi:hypothetical protein
MVCFSPRGGKKRREEGKSERKKPKIEREKEKKFKRNSCRVTQKEINPIHSLVRTSLHLVSISINHLVIEFHYNLKWVSIKNSEFLFLIFQFVYLCFKC